MAVREDAMVYVSAGEGKRGRHVPGEDAGIPWDTLSVRASDGAPVFLLVSALDDAAGRPWAMFFHGNAGMVGSRGNVSRYALLRDAGFNVLAVEFRGYGVSTRVPQVTEDGIYADAHAGLKYLADSLRVPPNRIIAYGWSLGSGPAARLASEAPLAALVTEGAFTSLPDLGADMYPWMPVRLLMRNRFDNAAIAGRVNAPWIVFHGRDDVEVPFTHGEALVAAATMGRIVPLQAGHGDGVTGDRSVALAELRALAQRIGVPITGQPQRSSAAVRVPRP